jgi:hypothetical protein
MHDNALTAPTRFADVDGRTLAYQMVGHGPPIVLSDDKPLTPFQLARLTE